jgi:hypothetical protein
VHFACFDLAIDDREPIVALTIQAAMPISADATQKMPSCEGALP